MLSLLTSKSLVSHPSHADKGCYTTMGCIQRDATTVKWENIGAGYSKHTWIKSVIGVVQSLDIVVRQVEIECSLNVLVRYIDSFVSLAQTREVPRPVDCQTHRTQRERIVVHIRMKLIRSCYVCVHRKKKQHSYRSGIYVVGSLKEVTNQQNNNT